VADQGFASKKYEVDAGGKGGDSFSTLMGKAIESDPSILSDPKKLAETSKNIRSMLPPDIKRGNNYQTGNVLNSSPAPTAPAVPSSVLPTPNRGGGNSMDFPTTMGTAQNQDKERQYTEDLFYRLNPNLKRKKTNWF
jgi:hypothetical protein